MGPPMLFPESNTRAYEVVHVQNPIFLIRQVLVKAAFAAKLVPSGTLTSATNWAQSQVDSAAADCVPTTATGTNDSTSATNIKAKPTENLVFMTVSLFSGSRHPPTL